LPEQYLTLSLAEWKERLRRGVTPRLCFVIGAGFSVSAGIPLARDISNRISLFEFYCDNNEAPWAATPPEKVSYSQVGPYLDWYSVKDGSGDDNLSELVAKAHLHLRRKRAEFESVEPSDPDYYSRLFEIVLCDVATRKHYLSELITRSQGVNFAHLGLAHLLIEKPDISHTVFSINFDDLLFQAVAALGGVCRIFGDVRGIERPSSSPVHSQLVHLHGRHTSYTTLHTSNELQTVDENLASAFETALAVGSLVVVGYRGWPGDFVMNTLARIQANTLGGNIYWIVYDPSDRATEEVKEHLADAPPGRVIFIEAGGKLDADHFMVEFLGAVGLNPIDIKAIAQVRAFRQHRFINQQFQELLGISKDREGETMFLDQLDKKISQEIDMSFSPPKGNKNNE